MSKTPDYPRMSLITFFNESQNKKNHVNTSK